MRSSPVQEPTAWSCSRPGANACRSRRISPTSRSETGWSVRAADRTRRAGSRSCTARVCCPPHIVAAPHGSIVVDHAGRSIPGEKYRPVQIDYIAELTEHERGSHRKTGADHVAHHDPQSQTARLPRHREALGESAALVELDVYHVEAAYEAGQVA